MPDGGLTTSMGHETNVDSILALDKRIEEATAELVRLKRSRNSLLTVTRVPPEILGYIFRFKITTEVSDPKFAGIQKDSYNFPLVCHHWFEVARRLPELWSFWGNSLEVWKRQLPHCDGIAPLDLVLDGVECRVGSLDETLLDSLKDYTARNAIRKVHLRSDDTQLLTTIVSSLTPEWCSRDSNIESIALNDVDVTAFLTHQSYPKLRDLSLSGCFVIRGEDWHFLKDNITTLVNLSLSSNGLTYILTVPQILSLLASNPNIRTLTLESLRIDPDIGYDSNGSHVPLRHLEKLSLVGDFDYLFPILQQLEFPEMVDHHARLEFTGYELEDIQEFFMPYIQDYFQRDPRFEGRLRISISLADDCISLQAGVIGADYHGPDRSPQQGPPYATFSVALSRLMCLDKQKKLCTEILVLLPKKSIVHFETNLTVADEMLVTMSNLETLHLVHAPVDYGFLLPDPSGPYADRKLLPSLRRLYLQDASANFGDFGPLYPYLIHQTSGDHPFSLYLLGQYMHICLSLASRIGPLVEEFFYDRDVSCPFNEYCYFSECGGYNDG